MAVPESNGIIDYSGFIDERIRLEAKEIRCQPGSKKGKSALTLIIITY